MFVCVIRPCRKYEDAKSPLVLLRRPSASALSMLSTALSDGSVGLAGAIATLSSFLGLIISPSLIQSSSFSSNDSFGSSEFNDFISGYAQDLIMTTLVPFFGVLACRLLLVSHTRNITSEDYRVLLF